MIRYKINILKELNKQGFNTSDIRKYKILSESVIQSIRSGAPISMSSLSFVCLMLDKDISEVIDFTPSSEECKKAADIYAEKKGVSISWHKSEALVKRGEDIVFREKLDNPYAVREVLDFVRGQEEE